jgi:hypothetical protein
MSAESASKALQICLLSGRATSTTATWKRYPKWFTAIAKSRPGAVFEPDDLQKGPRRAELEIGNEAMPQSYLRGIELEGPNGDNLLV